VVVPVNDLSRLRELGPFAARPQVTRSIRADPPALVWFVRSQFLTVSFATAETPTAATDMQMMPTTGPTCYVNVRKWVRQYTTDGWLNRLVEEKTACKVADIRAYLIFVISRAMAQAGALRASIPIGSPRASST
jgi:hypothetical protein